MFANRRLMRGRMKRPPGRHAMTGGSSPALYNNRPKPIILYLAVSAAFSSVNISIIGCGYLGCVIAASFAAAGHRVACYDIRRKNLDGNLPHEPGLKELLIDHRGRIAFVARMLDLLAHSRTLYFCLSAVSGDDGLIDIDNLLSSLGQIKNRRGLNIIVKTTVPVGTGRRIQASLKKNGNQDCRLVFEPEFTSEGTAVDDFQKAAYRVFGCDDNDRPAVAALVKELYGPLDGHREGARHHYMSLESAELSKLAINSMLACRLSFINELANYASECGADIDQLSEALKSDKRIGPHYLRPGIGYGGMCLPKDIGSLRKQMRERSSAATLTAAIEVNSRQHSVIASMIARRFSDLSQCRIAFLGYSFKGNTDDMRDSPALNILRFLTARRSVVLAYDPQASLPDEYASACAVCAELDEALSDCDCIVVGSDWPAFIRLDWPALARRVRQAVVFDCKNCLNAEAVRQAGFEYYAVGHAPPAASPVSR